MINRELSKKSRYDILASSFIPSLMPGLIHEFNNPLGVILNNIEALKDYLIDLLDIMDNHEKEKAKGKTAFIKQDLPNLAEEVESAKKRIVSILNGLQLLTSKEEQQTAQNLNTLIDKVLAVCWNEIKYSCKLTKEYGDLSPITINPKQIGLLLMVLLLNVIEVFKEQGELKITTKQEKNKIFVDFEDNRAKNKREVNPILERMECEKSKANEWIIAIVGSKQKGRVFTTKTSNGQKTTLELSL